MTRPAPLARFVDALCDALIHSVHGAGAPLRLAQQVTDALRTEPGAKGGQPALELPACKYLAQALGIARATAKPVAALATALDALAPTLSWRRRVKGSGDDPSFHDGHANAWIVAPDGLERRDDVIVGISLLAPHTRYPLHQHPPREIYLVLSDGEWFNPDQGWYRPGIGAVVYHPEHMLHAMRAGDDPLLAVWCLRSGE
ncbi:MAG: dimethylsulfonioproprionate lyase family protein [Betaproteobacteria bacterium]